MEHLSLPRYNTCCYFSRCLTHYKSDEVRSLPQKSSNTESSIGTVTGLAFKPSQPLDGLYDKPLGKPAVAGIFWFNLEVAGIPVSKHSGVEHSHFTVRTLHTPMPGHRDSSVTLGNSVIPCSRGRSSKSLIN